MNKVTINIFCTYYFLRLFPLLVVQMVKNPPAMWETWVRSRGWEDPLEEGMANYSSILAWRIPWTEGPGSLQSWGGKELDMTDQLSAHYFLSIHLGIRLTGHLIGT